MLWLEEDQHSDCVTCLGNAHESEEEAALDDSMSLTLSDAEEWACSGKEHRQRADPRSKTVEDLNMPPWSVDRKRIR